MRRLIVNADDLGVNPQRTHGIFTCFESGIVTSASVLPNCSDSDTAAKHAREKGLPVGLHLNLTEEYPLSKPEHIPGLVDMNGRFIGREKLRAALDADTLPRSSLEREVRSQIEWVFDAHGSPTHLDGHHHVHLHPRVIDVLLPIMERYGMRFVRIPYEPLPPYGYEISDAQLAWTKKIGEEAQVARQLYEAQGIGSTDHFRGLTLHGNASLKNLRHILGRLPEGTTELCVHPGSDISYGTPFDLDPQRQTELRMLTDDTIPLLLAERKIELCSWGDL